MNPLTSPIARSPFDRRERIRTAMRKCQEAHMQFLCTRSSMRDCIKNTDRKLANASTIVALSAVIAGCMGWAPGQQSYWDEKVKEMCEKDGGVKIYEKLRVSKVDIERLGRVGGKIGVPVKELAHPNSPAYSLMTVTNLREWNPRVSRVESIIIRRGDQAVVARSVVYARSGGDFPTGMSEGTSFSCPDSRKITSDLQELFVVEGDSK